MSRIGNKTITIPAGCEISVSDSNEVIVKGPKGTLSRQFSSLVGIKAENGEVNCTRANEEKHTKQLQNATKLLAAAKLKDDMQVSVTCFNTSLNQESVKSSETLLFQKLTLS